jgi:hypothetical protein
MTAAEMIPSVEKHNHARNPHTADPQSSRYWVAGTVRSICANSTCALASLRPDCSGMHTGGFCSQRDEEGSWDNVNGSQTDAA